MTKYKTLKYLRPTKARVSHSCNKCGKEIKPGDTYYSESLKDKFLHIVNPKTFCLECYNDFAEKLLEK